MFSVYIYVYVIAYQVYIFIYIYISEVAICLLRGIISKR